MASKESDVEYEEWPDCPIEGCPNKICLALQSDFCFPHTPGNEHVKRIDIDVRRILAGESELESPPTMG